MIISNTRIVARMGDAFYYAISVGKLQITMYDTGLDGKEIKRIIKIWQGGYRLKSSC